MATYPQIWQYTKKQFGYVPKPCWIAHMKELCGLNPRMAYNRHDPNKRVNPCPPEKQEDIRQVFKHFNMI